MIYSTQQQIIYVGEIVTVIMILGVYAFMILRSKREKDQKYRTLGWVAYGLAYFALIVLAFTVYYFMEG